MKKIFVSIVLLSLLSVPQFAAGSDVDDFKATVEKFVQAFNSFDSATIAKSAHPGMVGYNIDSPFPNVYSTSNAFRDSIQSWFDSLESLNIVLVNPQYRVVGNTGVMWGYETSTVNPKDGPRTTNHYRVTMTFVQSDGKWLLLTIHMSNLP